MVGFEFDREKVSGSSNRGFDALQTSRAQARQLAFGLFLWGSRHHRFKVVQITNSLTYEFSMNSR